MRNEIEHTIWVRGCLLGICLYVFVLFVCFVIALFGGRAQPVMCRFRPQCNITTHASITIIHPKTTDWWIVADADYADYAPGGRTTGALASPDRVADVAVSCSTARGSPARSAMMDQAFCVCWFWLVCPTGQVGD